MADPALWFLEQPVHCCCWLVCETQDLRETHQFSVVQSLWNAAGTQKWWEFFLNVFSFGSKEPHFATLLLTGCAYLECNKLSEVLFVCTWFAEVNLEMLILNCLVMKYRFDKVISIRKWLHYSLCCLPAAFQRVSSLHSFWPLRWPPVPVTVSQLYVGL